MRPTRSSCISPAIPLYLFLLPHLSLYSLLSLFSPVLPVARSTNNLDRNPPPTGRSDPSRCMQLGIWVKRAGQTYLCLCYRFYRIPLHLRKIKPKCEATSPITFFVTHHASRLLWHTRIRSLQTLLAERTLVAERTFLAERTLVAERTLAERIIMMVDGGEGDADEE